MMMATGGESTSPAWALRRLAGAVLAAARLRGSFSASKCKTEARMATARMKLLRNRREAQVRKMRGDIAALLRDSREDTARIRTMDQEIVYVEVEDGISEEPAVTKEDEGVDYYFNYHDENTTE